MTTDALSRQEVGEVTLENEYPLTHAHWTPEHFEKLLIWGTREVGMSDVKILPYRPIWMRIHGAWQPVIKKKLSPTEIKGIVDALYRGNASGMLMAGESLDWQAEVSVDRGDKLGFRCNATQVLNREAAPGLTMRTIPRLPPQLADMKVEPELEKHLFPNNGLFLVTGVMGSGKSTLLAAMIRHIIETQPRSIGTLEDPIEFQYADLKDTMGVIEQSGVGPHIRNFETGVRAATRRAFDVFLMGEARDPETLSNMLELAELGMCVYSTTHTRGVAETPGRILQAFGADERPAIMASLIDTMRGCIQQRLLERPEGGRTAIREFLIFDQDIRDELLGLDLADLKRSIARLVKEKGQDLLGAAERALDEKRILERDYKVIKAERMKEAK